MFGFTKLTLARQYILVSLLVMLGGMLIPGAWSGGQVERAGTKRTAAVTALYVTSYISPYLQELATDDRLSAQNLAALETLLADTTLGQQIVSFKVWSPEGVIVYSPNPELIGQGFAMQGGLAQAFDGAVISEVSDLEKQEQTYERQQWDTLIETYAPARAVGSGEIIAVAEFYQTTAGLTAEIRAAQIRSWLMVGAVMATVYLLLAGIVGRASNTIVAQQNTLQANVQQLQTLLAQNDLLHGRVRRAAGRTTALSEQHLRRISADLHDGPAQDLALALLRMESLADAFADAFADAASADAAQPAVQNDFQTVHAAIEAAMSELRTISAGLRLPAIEPLSLSETIRRAVYDYEQKTDSAVVVTLGDLPDDAPLPVKITLFRFIHEALANGYRHAGGKGQTVHVYVSEATLYVEIMDAGPGFAPQTAVSHGRLGLVGMRERGELLGGQFELASKPGLGTAVRASLPLIMPEEPYV